MCFIGSDLTAVPMVRVGVVSRDDSRDDLDGTCLVTDVVMRFVTTVCFLPLGSVTVILSPPASFLRAAFLLAIADWVSVVKEAVARPGPIPRRAMLVRPEAVSEGTTKKEKRKKDFFCNNTTTASDKNCTSIVIPTSLFSLSFCNNKI